MARKKNGNNCINYHLLCYLCPQIDTEKLMNTDSNEAKTPRTYHCNDCGGIIYRHEVFCSKCGKLLDHFDFADE